MTYSRRINILITVFTCCTLIANAQNKPIGYWRSHLPYNVALGVATDGKSLITICSQAFFTLDGTNSSAVPETYSKVEGMSDIGMKCVAYDKTTSTSILVYTNGNIDLFKEKENTFYNIPDLKIKSISGDKTVNMAYAENGIAYLSTSVGILVIDLTSHNVIETYQFNVNNQNVPVTGFAGNGTYFYAIAKTGLYRADKNNPQLQNFQVWQLMDTITSFTSIASFNNQLFIATPQSVYTVINDTLHLVYTCSAANGSLIQRIDPGTNGILISEFYPNIFYGRVKAMNSGYLITDSFTAGHPMQAVQLSDGTIWIADNYYGLGQLILGGLPAFHIPAGPSGPYSYDIYAYNKDLWIAHGGFNDNLYATPYYDGVSNFHDEKWTAYKHYIYHPFDTVDAFVAIAKDQTNGTLYLGSYLNGLFTLNPDGSFEILNQYSIFDSSSSYFGNNQRQIVSLALDKDNNLWVTELGAKHQLYEKNKSDGSWHRFRIPENINGGPIAIDDFGQVWFVSYTGGVICFNPGIPITDSAQLTYYHFVTGVGTGNLPSNKVTCIAKDNSNSIWIGTDDGIGIISNCSITPGMTAPCDAQIPIVQYDQFAGYLFAGNVIRSIAVDGANRKWVGTDDGIWLLSPNAQKIIYRFTSDNSPLPSNLIKKITVDKVTGDVYIGTENGLISYRSTATDGTLPNQGMEIFPNPVTSGYNGTIGIKGLPANADVRITDIDGQLVYKTTALGGQAVWNGIDYKGHRPQTGVYLVFVTNSDGGQISTGKIVFMQ